MKIYSKKRNCLIIMLMAVILICVAFAVTDNTKSVNAAEVTTNWANYKATGYNGGDGSVATPFLIATPQQLAYFASVVNGGDDCIGKYFKLVANINLEAHIWNPIGYVLSSPATEKPFKGNFNGDNWVVSNILTSNLNYQGLFGYIENATISNVIVHGDIKGYDYVGGVAGRAKATTFANCINMAQVKATGYAGGIVGEVNTSSVISNCVNSGDINASSYTGGIAGSIYGASNVNSCYNNASVSGESNTGGIAGYLYKSNINNCYNTGIIEGKLSNVGGIIGYVYDASSIIACYNIGNIEGVNRVGGISGKVESASVNNCYSAGIVNGAKNSDYIGGVIGESINHSVANCYYNNIATTGRTAIGKVSDETTVKGLTFTQMTGSGALANMVFNPSNAWLATVNTVIDGKEIYYYPQLKAFSDSINPKFKNDSPDSVTVTKIAKPTAITGLYYNGEEQLGVDYDSDYIIVSSGTDTGKNINTYICVLKLKPGCMWTDDTFTDVTVIFNITKGRGEGTVSMGDWAYGQAHKSPSFEITKGDYLVASVKYYYKLSTATEWTELTTYPTVAGAYNIKAVFAETNYYGELVLQGTFNITTIQLTNQLGDVTGTFIYSGSEHTPTPNVTGLTSDDYDVSYSNNIDAGTATITITGKGSYGGSISKTFIIQKANGTGTVTINGWSANQTPNVPNATSETNGTNNIKVEYKLKNASDSTYSVTAPTNTGTYTVRVTFEENENYNELIITADFTIGMAMWLIITIVAGGVLIAVLGIFAIFRSTSKKRRYE